MKNAEIGIGSYEIVRCSYADRGFNSIPHLIQRINFSKENLAYAVEFFEQMQMPEPKNPFWLIEKAPVADRKYRAERGVDEVCRFDYMGSTEFEFGAIGKTLRAIRAFANHFTVQKVVHNDVTLTVLSPYSKHAIEFYLQTLKDVMLKESSYFENSTTNATTRCKCDAWLDLDNHFLFWISNEFDDTIAKIYLTKRDEHGNPVTNE